VNGMAKVMRELQKLQGRVDALQEKLASETVEASAGGGAVKVKVSGNQEVHEITIDPDAVDPDDVEMLQDLILAAVNEGLRLAKEMMAKETEKLTGGLKLPGIT